MRTQKYVATLAGLVTLSAAGAAFAQDDWTGAYIGGHVGGAGPSRNNAETVLFDTDLNGQFGNTVNTSTGVNAFSPGFCGGAAQATAPTAGCGKDDGGADYGLRAGYDWQYGSWLFGVVGEISSAKVEDSVTAFSTTPASYTLRRELDSVVAARVRGGYVMGRYLGYVTAGAASGKVDHSFSTSNTVNTFTQRGDDRASGYQVGLGVEAKTAANITLGVEYLFTSLDDDDFTVRAAGPAPATNPFILTNTSGTDFRRSEDKFKFGSLRLTASYRF